MLLGKVLSIVAASAALLDGSMKAAMPDKNMEGTMFLINRQHAVSEFFVPETLRKVDVYKRQGKTFAEMTEKEKNAVSHRAVAAEKMRGVLAEAL